MTDIAAPALCATDAGIVVQAAAAQSLKLTGFPTTVIAGTLSTFTVTAYDKYGNIATGYAGTINFTSSDNQALLPANYTFVASNAGICSFSATLETPGVQSIEVADLTNGLTATDSGIKVTPAPTLKLTGFSTTVTAGTISSFTVTIYSPSGQVDTGYTGTIRFTSTDPAAVLPGSYTFTAANAGMHTFSGALKAAGGQSITATDTANSKITGAELGITVQPAAARLLTVAGFPTSVTAGEPSSFTVVAYDSYGNIATGYTGTIQFASNDSRASLPANYTFTAGDAGKQTFSAVLLTAGFHRLTATDTTTPSMSDSEYNIYVQPGAAASLNLTPSPPATRRAPRRS